MKLKPEIADVARSQNSAKITRETELVVIVHTDTKSNNSVSLIQGPLCFCLELSKGKADINTGKMMAEGYNFSYLTRKNVCS